MAAVDFGYLQDALTRDAELRERVRDVVRQLEQAQRASLAVLARVHSCPDSQIPELVSSLEPTLSPLRSHLSDLAALIPPQQFYRYSDSFSRSIQQASFIIVFRVFLEREDVPSKEEVAQQLGIQEAWKDHFFLSTEEYLHSLISLVNELSRLAVNRVTLGDYGAPARYSRFAKELANAFGLLNLKNDSLRKRFDSIKYDVKRLEEVVYDLSLRGLLASASTDASAATQSDGPAPAKRMTGATLPRPPRPPEPANEEERGYIPRDGDSRRKFAKLCSTEPVTLDSPAVATQSMLGNYSEPFVLPHFGVQGYIPSRSQQDLRASGPGSAPWTVTAASAHPHLAVYDVDYPPVFGVDESAYILRHPASERRRDLPPPAPPGKVRTGLLPHDASAGLSKKRRSSVIDVVEGVLACDVCRRNIASGFLKVAATGEPAGASVEVFPNGRKTCQLAHNRIGTTNEMDYDVWAVESIQPTDRQGVVERCRELFYTYCLGTMGVPDMLESVAPLCRSFEEAEKLCVDAWLYLALRWATPTSRKKRSKKRDGPSAIDAEEKGSAPSRPVRNGKTLTGFIMAEHNLISGIVHVVLTLPTGAGEAYESSTRLLQTLLARVQEDVVALNAERDCMRLPPYPLLHTAWTLHMTKRDSRIMSRLETRRGFVPLEDFLVKYPEVGLQHFPPQQEVYLPPEFLRGFTIYAKPVRREDLPPDYRGAAVAAVAAVQQQRPSSSQR
ncbi:hypothetical protein B0A53_03635 [Rhodotorula sp. CCFEE 5036]|nr:hypothetical protein B0A53_03635 [Rhodotorula sp. CCFEE 5036]